MSHSKTSCMYLVMAPKKGFVQGKAGAYVFILNTLRCVHAVAWKNPSHAERASNIHASISSIQEFLTRT